MADFRFIEDKASGKWVILAPRRAKRPDEAKGTEGVCPFCPERASEEKELFRIGQVRVLANKYPFAPIHEVIVHSNDHHKNFGELGDSETQNVFQVYRERFKVYRDSGQVYIFHNRGEAAGESLTHPHSQLVVIPNEVKLEIPVLSLIDQNTSESIKTELFILFSPISSQWPDEVWIAPQNHGQRFDTISDEEVEDISKTITKLIKVLEIKLGKEFPYNFYISPGKNWYLRLTPRTKLLGGFEIGTNVFVNTEDPAETMKFLKENF